MTEKEVLSKKIETIISFILERGEQDVSKYSHYYYQKLVLLFEKVKKSLSEFMPSITGVLDEKSYEEVLKSYQKVLKLTEEAITLFLQKNVGKDEERIWLKNIPVQNEKMGDYYELVGILNRILKMKRRKNIRLLDKKTYEEVSEYLYSLDVSKNVELYEDYLNWPGKLELANTEYGYLEDKFYGNILMYSLELGLNYSNYFGLSSFLVEDYDTKKRKDMEKQEKRTSITVDDVRMICTTLKYYELREMDVLLLWKERTSLLKFLEDALEEPMLIEAAGGMDAINDAIEKIDDVLQAKQWKGR